MWWMSAAEEPFSLNNNKIILINMKNAHTWDSVSFDRQP